MGFINWVGSVAQGVDDLQGAITGPGRARLRTQSAADARDQRRDTSLATAQALRDRELQAASDSKIAVENLPANLQVANATQGVINSGKVVDSDLAIQQTAALGDQTRQTMGTAVDGGVKIIGAKAKGDIDKQTSFVTNVIPGLNDGLLAPQRAHETAQLRMFLGDVPLAERQERMQAADRASTQAMIDAEKNDPMNWVRTAGGIAAAAGALFL